MKHSIPNPEIIINNYKEYRKLYLEHINKYPELINRYGSYDDFFKILNKDSEEYNNLKFLFKKDYFQNIKYIVKTYEGLIDGQKVINKIEDEIKIKNIKINYNEEVEKINENNNYYIIKTNKNNYKSKIVILCSWHNNEKLIKEIKYNKNILPIITKRLKALCNVYIDLYWCEKTNITSMFECMGAGFMISLPKGKENIVNINNKLYYKAKITYAPITNLFKYDDIEEPLWINDLLKYGKISEINKKYVPDELKNKLNNVEQLIIDGISHNFKNIKENIIFESIKYGIVCTEGIINNDINKEFINIDSYIHKRSYSGIYKLQENNNKILIANYGMKFIYSIKNSDDVLNILEKYKERKINNLKISYQLYNCN